MNSASKIDSNVTENEREEIYSWLREFNLACNGEFWNSLEDEAEKEFFFVARDSSGKVSGGLQGMIIHSWVRIEIMAVSPDMRKEGIGAELVTSAEEHGRSHGCQYAYVDTMSYQAPAFYEKLGYQECGRLKNWDSHGHDKIFFTKSL